jgi:MscS family membrane protein
MEELLGVIFHPSRWSNVEELSSHQRILLSLFVLSITAVVATFAGMLSARWARGRSRDAGGTIHERIAGIRRTLVLLVVSVGGYASVQVAPLPSAAERALSGTLFVVGAFVTARFIIHVVTLVLATSVAYASTEDRARLEREYVPMVAKGTTLTVGLILVVVVAKHFGQDVTSLVAALGVGSLAIGLAAQQTLGNMIAGFVLLVDRPFRPSDRIRLASGEAGEVVEIGVRSTRIVLGDRNLLIVPNAELVNSRVVNFTFPSSVTRGEVKVLVAHGTDVDRAAAILTGIAAGDERVQANPAPSVRVSAILPLGIELAVGFDVALHPDVIPVEDKVRRRLLEEFAKHQVALARAIDARPV